MSKGLAAALLLVASPQDNPTMAGFAVCEMAKLSGYVSDCEVNYREVNVWLTGPTSGRNLTDGTRPAPSVAGHRDRPVLDPKPTWVRHPVPS